MTQKLLILSASLIILNFSFSNAESPLPDNILEIQPLIEQSLDLKNYPLGRNLPYSSLDKIFNKYCSVKSIEEGLAESEQKYSLIKDELSINSQARLWDTLSLKRFNTRKYTILQKSINKHSLLRQTKIPKHNKSNQLRIKQLLHPCLLPMYLKKKRLKPDSSHEKKFDPEN